MLLTTPSKQTLARIAILAGFALQFHARAGEIAWKQHTINAKSDFESSSAFDVNNDGKLDVVSGDTWYEAPEWKPHHVRDVERAGRTYRNCFATLPMDVNADGFQDFVTVAYFPKNVGWVENPGQPDKDWTYHEIDLPGTSEAAKLVDLTGDGKPEVLPNPTNVVVWYELEKAGPKPIWKKHDFGKEAAGHGVGSGDVNGDGRVDLLTPKGWFEAPLDPSNDTWTWHAAWDLGATGIQILAKDVDGDGLADVVFGKGHDYGLYWLKQSKKSAKDPSEWTKQAIDESIASVHSLIWADLDGDGKSDELVTGKRVYAHEIEPGATDASVVAYYDFDRSLGKWTRHVVFQGKPAEHASPKGEERNAQTDFPAGTAGTGLQIEAVDIDGDGDLDLLCPGKSGLYWFENLGKS